MSSRTPSGQARTSGERAVARHGWAHALVTVLGGLLAMALVSALGLWAAGAADLPDGSFAPVIAATMVTAVGGTVKLAGGAGDLAETRAGLTVIPLSVTLTGALVIAWGFLRPLRHRAVAGATELAGWAGRVAALWLLALIGLTLAARHTFEISLGDDTLGELGDLFGASPKIGFTTDVPLSVFVGVVWLAGVLVLALLVSRGAPLPAGLLRFQASVRPAAYAMVALLLACVVIGVVVALIVAVTKGHARETFAVILLGIPNLVWMALTIGLGATWNGRVWWLLVVNVVLLLAAAFVMAARSPSRVRAWQHAVHMAVALALTVFMICLVGRISAHYGLSVLGIGDLGGGLGGELFLRPKMWGAVGLAVPWGLVTGFAGALLARHVRRRGEVRPDSEG